MKTDRLKELAGVQLNEAYDPQELADLLVDWLYTYGVGSKKNSKQQELYDRTVDVLARGGRTI